MSLNLNIYLNLHWQHQTGLIAVASDSEWPPLSSVNYRKTVLQNFQTEEQSLGKWQIKLFITFPEPLNVSKYLRFRQAININ